MDIEILFLDDHGKFRCSMRSGFLSSEAATRYAQSVMRTRFCRHYALAEIYAPDSLFPATVSRESNSRLLDLRGRFQQDAKPRKFEPVDPAFAARPVRARQIAAGTLD